MEERDAVEERAVASARPLSYLQSTTTSTIGDDYTWLSAEQSGDTGYAFRLTGLCIVQPKRTL